MNALTVSIQDILAAAKPVLRQAPITWDGKTATFYFQRLSFGEHSDLVREFVDDKGMLSDDRAKQFRAAAIAKTVRDSAGAPVLTAEQVMGLEDKFVDVLNAEFGKANPTSTEALEAAAKNSEPTTPSPSS